MRSTHLLMIWDNFGTLVDNLRRIEAHRIELRWVEANWVTSEQNYDDLRWIGDKFEACRRNWRQFQSAKKNNWTIVRQFGAFPSNWVEVQSSMRVMGTNGGILVSKGTRIWANLDRYGLRERTWHGTRRNLRIGEVSRLLNAWLIAEGDAWGTSHGGLVCINLRTLWSHNSI